MAGQRGGVFVEKLPKYLKLKYEAAERDPLREADVLNVLGRQYLVDPREAEQGSFERRRHYEAEVELLHDGRPVRGIERLYRRTILFIPTLVCAAHCRWCVRGQYPITHLAPDDIERAARYCGESPEAADVEELLVTGGDPLMDPGRLELTLDAFARWAPRIRMIRIASRVPLHDPDRIDAGLLALLAAHSGRIELALHVNHRAELFPEVREAIERLGDAGVRAYNQSVLLRGVNDRIDALEDLCEALRAYRIETHYLFHCVPIRGMAHHRTTVDEGLRLARELTNSGRISGRAKPRFTLLTDVGKVTLLEGTILERRDGRILLQTAYSADERRALNPTWKQPDSAIVGADGRLRVWYQDGADASAAPLRDADAVSWA
jgi:lysine 2,3-aminomutase